MAILKKIILLSLVVILTGCYSDFEPDLESSPVVCINANAVVGEELIIYVTRTWRWSEFDAYKKDLDLKNAEVRLWVNGENFGLLEYATWESGNPWWMDEVNRFRGSGYKTGYIPKSGDEIRITVHDVEFGDAEGEVNVPYPVLIDDVNISGKLTLTVYGALKIYSGNLGFELLFSDPGDDVNYYQFKAGLTSDYDNIKIISYPWFDFNVEPLFSEHVSSLESVVSEIQGYTFFSDRMISGQTYPIHIRLEDLEFQVDSDKKPDEESAYITFRLNVISESYYKHVISVWESNDGVNGMLGGLGLADHVWECSNVSTGAGVISAVCPSDVRLPLISLFP